MDAGRIMIGMSLLLIMIALIIHPVSATGTSISHMVGFEKCPGSVAPQPVPDQLSGTRHVRTMNIARTSITPDHTREMISTEQGLPAP